MENLKIDNSKQRTLNYEKVTKDNFDIFEKLYRSVYPENRFSGEFYEDGGDYVYDENGKLKKEVMDKIIDIYREEMANENNPTNDEIFLAKNENNEYVGQVGYYNIKQNILCDEKDIKQYPQIIKLIENPSDRANAEMITEIDGKKNVTAFGGTTYKEYRRHGYALQAILDILNYLFNIKNFDNVCTQAEEGNIPSNSLIKTIYGNPNFQFTSYNTILFNDEKNQIPNDKNNKNNFYIMSKEEFNKKFNINSFNINKITKITVHTPNEMTTSA